MVKEKKLNAKDYAAQGNAAIKEEKYFPAALSYTFAIKLDLRNAELYSNRSFAFLKTGQLYYALEDADQTIKLKPQWAKGYFRRGEVLFAANQYIEAVEAYEHAYRLQPSETSLRDCIEKCKRELAKIKKQDEQMPWVGAAIGLVIGLVAIVFEYFILENFLLSNPFLQVIAALAVCVAGYYIALLVRKYVRSYRDSLIEKPVDLFE